MFYKLFIIICIAFILVSCTSRHQKVLYIFNWTDYIDDALLRQFEKKHNCKIVYDTYNSNENMLTKLLTSKSSYDIVVPSGDHVAIMIQKGLLEQIDKSLLGNYGNLDEVILEKSHGFDPDNLYSVPYFWGTTGLIYHKKNVPFTVLESNSWYILASTYFKNKNKVTMLDDAREVIGAALITAGFSPNVTSDAAIAAADKIVMTWDVNVSQYDSDSFKNEIQDGTTWVAQAYNGDALQIMDNNPDIGFILPNEGTSLWIDSIVIPKYSENKELAYKFIDFLLEAENGKKNAEYVQYATPNKASLQLLSDNVKSNPLIYPDDEYLDRCYMIENIGENVLKIDQLWQKVKK